MREQARSFSSMAGIQPRVERGDDRARAGGATGRALRFGGILSDARRATRRWARTFTPEEDRKTTPSKVVVLSHGFWQRRLGGSRDVMGQSLNLDGGTYTVIGVLPADFRYAGEPLAGSATDIAVWFPLSANQIVGSVRSRALLESGGAAARRSDAGAGQGRGAAAGGGAFEPASRSSIAASSGTRVR